MNFKKYYHPLLFLIIMAMPKIVDASVIFSEVAWMGTPESANAEWIEFYNTSADIIDMSGWKLYEAGGSTLVYTFTKQIPAKTYFVLERVTPSAPDPLPDIGDEAGSFGGSGLSNSGEYLVLKDVAGTTIAELDASSGWPAGDSTEKKTMQRSNGTWISAEATPKAAPQTGTIDGTSDVPPKGGGTAAPASSGSQTPPPPPRSTASYIKIQFPEQVFLGQKSTFSFVPYVGGDERAHGYFYWNMGDGTVYEYTKNEKVSHTYSDIGKYSVTVSFGYSPYVDPLLIETTIVSVLDPSLSLSLEKEGSIVSLLYTGEGMIDVGRWTLSSAEGSYVFPVRSRLLGGTALRIKSTTNFPFHSNSLFSLTTSEGMHVASLGHVPPPKTKQQSIKSSLLEATAVNAIEKRIAPIEEKTITDVPSSSQKSKQKNKSVSYIVLGGLILILIGIFVFLDRKMGESEEEER